MPEDPVTALVALELACWEVLAAPVAAALCACIAAIRLWMNACMACAGSESAVLAEVLDEVDAESAAALVPEVESLVTPICDSACRMESISPPPGGGGGGCAAALTLGESVTSDCVLVLVLELEASCASQLLRLDTLLIVMSVSRGGQIESRHNIDDRGMNSRDRGIKMPWAACEQLLPILTGGTQA